MGSAAPDRPAPARRQDPVLQSTLDRLVALARSYHASTGRHLSVYGEIGELYAATRLGLRLHRPHAQGSDGRLGNDFVEVKTIGPMSRSRTVTVETKGHFGKLVVVRVDEAFRLSHRMVDRAALRARGRKRVTLRWDALE